MRLMPTAVLGAPNDMGTQWRPVVRVSAHVASAKRRPCSPSATPAAYDHEDDTMYLTEDQVRMVDVGDADIVHTDQAKSNANIECAVRKILEKGACLGGAGRRPLHPRSGDPCFRRPRADPHPARRRPSRFRRRAPRCALRPRQPAAPRLRDGPRNRHDTDRHPQRVLVQPQRHRPPSTRARPSCRFARCDSSARPAC